MLKKSTLLLAFAPSFLVFRVETHTATLKMHETRFEEIGRLAGRVSIVEETLTKISGESYTRIVRV